MSARLLSLQTTLSILFSIHTTFNYIKPKHKDPPSWNKYISTRTCWLWIQNLEKMLFLANIFFILTLAQLSKGWFPSSSSYNTTHSGGKAFHFRLMERKTHLLKDMLWGICFWTILNHAERLFMVMDWKSFKGHFIAVDCWSSECWIVIGENVFL